MKICSWNNWQCLASFWMTWQFHSVPYSANCQASLISLALWVVLPHAQSEIDDMWGLGVKIWTSHVIRQPLSWWSRISYWCLHSLILERAFLGWLRFSVEGPHRWQWNPPKLMNLGPRSEHPQPFHRVVPFWNQPTPSTMKLESRGLHLGSRRPL
jgi:hypothetical protein